MLVLHIWDISTPNHAGTYQTKRMAVTMVTCQVLLEGPGSWWWSYETLPSETFLTINYIDYQIQILTINLMNHQFMKLMICPQTNQVDGRLSNVNCDLSNMRVNHHLWWSMAMIKKWQSLNIVKHGHDDCSILYFDGCQSNCRVLDGCRLKYLIAIVIINT